MEYFTGGLDCIISIYNMCHETFTYAMVRLILLAAQQSGWPY